MVDLGREYIHIHVYRYIYICIFIFVFIYVSTPKPNNKSPQPVAVTSKAPNPVQTSMLLARQMGHSPWRLKGAYENPAKWQSISTNDHYVPDSRHCGRMGHACRCAAAAYRPPRARCSWTSWRWIWQAMSRIFLQTHSPLRQSGKGPGFFVVLEPAICRGTGWMLLHDPQSCWWCLHNKIQIIWGLHESPSFS